MEVFMLNSTNCNLEQFLSKMDSDLVAILKEFGSSDLNSETINHYQKILNLNNVFFEYDMGYEPYNLIYLHNRKGTQNVLYADDIDYYDNANTISYLNDNSVVTIKICRDKDSKEIIVYDLELFQCVADSYVSENHLHDINDCLENSYHINEQFVDFYRMVDFSNALADYDGPINFDTSPIVFKNDKKYHKWLRKRINLKF